MRLLVGVPRGATKSSQRRLRRESEPCIAPAIHSGAVARAIGMSRQHVDRTQRGLDIGFDHIFLHNVSTEQELFIEDFDAHVLPRLGPP
jgi:hypothetical protein